MIVDTIFDNSPTPKLLVLIRHAESVRNATKNGSVYFPDEESRGRYRGTPDHNISLSDEGVKHAHRISPPFHSLFGIPNFIFHSGYKRVTQTIDAMLSSYGHDELQETKTAQDFLLRERDPGFIYDMTHSEANHFFPFVEEHFHTKRPFFARPPGGESLADVAVRLRIFWHDVILRLCANKRVFIFAHGGTSAFY
ncbi:MAG: phosphoglycerate mutase family protein [Candidatus Moranbacteria bacterium]|nr:phosphoglycerate mutase family protein [Candidatus Moranbacteria bacterium]